MLVGKEGAYTKPTHPCLVPGCTDLAHMEGGACKKHMFEKIEWLRRRVMTRPSPWAPGNGTSDQEAEKS